MTRHVVIIGASYAGVQAAVGAREAAPDCKVTLIDSEDEVPYQRPPLSKRYLQGDMEDRSVWMRAPAFYDERSIDRVFGLVQAVDPTQQSLALADGRSISYDSLVLATGATCRTLNILERTPRNLHYLRTLADAKALREAVRNSRRVLIIGAGFIGMEVAASAIQLGRDVTVVYAGSRPMEKTCSAEVSSFLQHQCAMKGVHFLPHESVENIYVEEGAAKSVTLRSGQVIECDVIIAGLGVLPNLDLATAADVLCDELGILVREDCSTSVPAVFAAGDCTSVAGYQVYSDAGRLKIESVQHASEMGRAAGASAAGSRTTYRAVPWFWSDQFENKLQIAGVIPPNVSAIRLIRGDPASARFSVVHVRTNDGSLAAVESINWPQDHLAARKLIERRSIIAPEVLADGQVSLRDIAKEVSSPSREECR